MKLRSVLLYVPDVPAAVAFYGAAFGLAPTMQTPDGQYAQMDSGETALAFAAEEAAPALGLPMAKARTGGDAAPAQLTFEADDVEAAFARVVAAGGTVLNAPSAKPWGQTLGHVRDFNGFVVEIGTPQPEGWDEA